MKQYARAIQEFQRKRGALPTTLEQLTEQENPRILRQLYANPLTGEVDWILVAAGTPTPAQIITNPAAPGSPQQAPAPQPIPPGGPGSQIGPFIGVRLPNTGESFLELNESSKYEEWIYTLNELQRDQGPVVVPPMQSVPGN